MESGNVSSGQPPKKPDTVGLSLLVNPPRPALDIVFIHGFTGHPERTWTHKGAVPSDDDDGGRPSKFRKILPSHHTKVGVRKSIYWPRDLVPIAAPDARVFTYGYDTQIRHWAGPPVNKSTVYDIAGDFLVSLEIIRRSDPSRPLLFVAHSLGGIIVKEALRRSRGAYQGHLRDIYESTSGVLFFGTPHSGADPRGTIHKIAEKCIQAAGFSVNEQIVNTLLPSSERLRELREEFSPMARQKNWLIYSFQEQYGIKELLNNKVVDDTASCLNDPSIEVTQHIASNHMDMCRFSGLDDPEYEKVAGALHRAIRATSNSVPSGSELVLSTDQRRSYLSSLKYDQIDARHATIKKAHARTCTWLLGKDEYHDWLDINKISEHHGFLWIKGKPGTGKSTLMKFAYANAPKKMMNTTIISFFFNARGEDLEKSVLGMYRSLLYQLLEALPDLQSLFDFVALPGAGEGEFYRWDTHMVKDIFGQAVEKLGERSLTCFIDALDECEEDQVVEMVAFFAHLGQLAVTSRSRFLVCFSSRHYPHITIENGIELVLEGQEGHQQDIASYLHSELKAGRSKLIEEIKVEILERACGIFLWVVLVVQMLNKEYSRGRIHALRKRLDEIPDGLHELFRDILTRDGNNLEDLIICLQWMLYAKRPLKREELYYAILAGVEPEAVTAWNPGEITKGDMERFILSSSKGLAEVTKSKSQTVQFIHESVQDFLMKGDGLEKMRLDLGSKSLGSNHERLKQCCQTYMKVDTSEHLPLSGQLPTASSPEAAALRQVASERYPFLEYATHNVLYHADVAQYFGASQEAFVRDFNRRDCIFLDNVFEKFQIRRHTSDASLLYIFAEKNLSNLILIELQRVPRIDIKGERYFDPVFAAMAEGSEKSLNALLRPHNGLWSDGVISHDHPMYSTPESYEQTMRHLLKNAHNKDISNKIIQKGQTLLSWAAQQGDWTLVKILLATGKVEIDVRGKHGRTPLSYAAGGSNENIIRLILASGEIHNNTLGTIKQNAELLHFNFNVNSKDKFGRTPLSHAAECGRAAVVELLLARTDVDADSKDNNGRTPLSHAAKYGRAAVFKLLLARTDVDADLKDKNGRTLLSLAAVDGHRVVVQLLLARTDVDVNLGDNNGRTPLSHAAADGRREVVKLLLARTDVDVNLGDNNGRTPLSIAVKRGHRVVVELLLARTDVDVNLGNNNGWTPLSFAAERGHEAVVELLVARPDVDVNLKDNEGRTPLSRAAEHGHGAVVKLLLARPDVDVNLKDNAYGGQTPLSIVADRGNAVVVGLLLARPDVNADSKDNDGRTPLSHAAADGRRAVVKLLLARPDVDANLGDNNGRTPLSHAAEHGHGAMVELLLARPDVDVNLKDNEGRTPLSYAVVDSLDIKGSARAAVVKLLLARTDVDVNLGDNNGRTPLSIAAGRGHRAVVKLLLARTNIDVNLKDNEGRTPLSYATRRGNDGIIQLLRSIGAK